MKKEYSKPTLAVYGTVQKITKQGGTVVPTDVPNGIIGEAFPLS